jgi:hypothetical protein
LFLWKQQPGDPGRTWLHDLSCSRDDLTVGSFVGVPTLRFRSSDTGSSRNADLIWAAAAFAGYTAVMLALERRMHRSGGPGIVAFEVAGNAQRAQRIMSTWGDDGRRAARRSLQLDFGYMATYGALTALLLDRARRRLGHPVAVCLGVVPAVAGDALEGVALLNVLAGNDIDSNARRARRAAMVKFVSLIGALLYATGAYLPRGRRDQ